jgi:uncharacterized protein
MTPTPAVLAVALYAGLNGLILMWLATNVGRTRMRLRIGMGDAGSPEMIRAMRGQANFVEYVPLILLQMTLTALMGAPALVLHLFGATLTLGRLLHGWHFTHGDAPGWQRSSGAALTMLALLGASLGLIAHAIYRMT